MKNIQEAVQRGDYALRPHAVTHMLAEGFDEADIGQAVGNGKIIEHYMEGIVSDESLTTNF